MLMISSSSAFDEQHPDAAFPLNYHGNAKNRKFSTHCFWILAKFLFNE